MSEIYDLIILGAGPAGIGAAIYASRAKLNMLWIEKKFVQGGQITDTYEVDNYPGMPGISGMEIPRQIQNFLPNVRIIFVTSHTEYAIDAFELSIFRYVPKSNLEAKLTAAVTDAAKLIELEAGQEYIIQTANRMEKIPYRDIFYIQRDGKNACIVSSTGISKVRKSLQQVYQELNAPEFLFTDRGCIVNIIHIMKISGSTVILKNREQLPVSRSHLQEVKQKINRFWGAHI